MNYFLGDYYGHRCIGRTPSSAIFNDHLDIVRGMARDVSKLCLYLHRFATSEEYQSWESHMLQGFHRCRTYDDKFDDYSAYRLAYRRVDEEIASGWSAEVKRYGLTLGWEEFKNFLRECFMPSIRLRSSPTSSLNVKAIKKPPKKVQTLVPLQNIEEAAAILAQIPKVVPVAVSKDVVDDVVPLSGLNVQLKRVHGDTCVPVDRSQRWNLFQ